VAGSGQSSVLASVSPLSRPQSFTKLRQAHQPSGIFSPQPLPEVKLTAPALWELGPFLIQVDQALPEHCKPNAHPEAPACRAGAEGEREIDAQDAAPSDIWASRRHVSRAGSTSVEYTARTQWRRVSNRRQRAEGSKRNAAKAKNGARGGGSHPRNARLNGKSRPRLRSPVELGWSGSLQRHLGTSAILTGKR